MIVSSPLFEAYLECSTKCWLRSRAEPKTPNAYAEWASLQNETYYQDRIKCLLEMFPESDRVIAPSISKHAKDAAWRIATDVHLRMNGLETYLQAVERRPSEARGRPAQFIPYRFRFANKLTKNDKMSLAFDANVLAETLGCEVSLGKIIHGNDSGTLKVNLSPLASALP